MPTCLDDLKASIDALVAALDGSLGGVSLTVSNEAQASSQASSQAWVLNNVQVAAIAAAQAYSLALVDIDISVSLTQTTTITNVTLPAVSVTVPPNLTVFPTADTGVTDVERDNEGATGSKCQAIYYAIDTLQALTTILSKFPQIGYLATNVMSFAIIPAVQTLEFFLSQKGIIIPKASLVAIEAFLFALASANIAVGDMLNEAAFWLATNRDALAQTVYCTILNGGSSLDVASAVQDNHSLDLSEEALQFLLLLLTSNLIGALIYTSPIFDPSAQSEEDCPACE